MATPNLDGFEAHLNILDRDLLTVCDELEVTVQTSPGFTLFRGIHYGHRYYRDKGALCGCAALRLFKFADDAYALCAAHGLQPLGYLVREFPTHVQGCRHG